MNHLVSRGVSIAGLVLLAGCAHQKTSDLYVWESFPRQQYDTLLSNGSSPDQQIQTLEAQAEKARGANSQLPPGFRAHLGMLYLNTGNVDRARELWLAEKGAFPESAPYMDRLLGRLNAPPANAAKKGVGA